MINALFIIIFFMFGVVLVSFHKIQIAHQEMDLRNQDKLIDNIALNATQMSEQM